MSPPESKSIDKSMKSVSGQRFVCRFTSFVIDPVSLLFGLGDASRGRQIQISNLPG